MSGLPPPGHQSSQPPGAPPNMPPGMLPTPGQQPPLQIKVGWFKENSLEIKDLGMAFEQICLPRNLLHVQKGQFDALLTVRTQEDINNIQKELSTKGVKIKDQKLSEYMVVGAVGGQGGPP